MKLLLIVMLIAIDLEKGFR